MTSHFGRRQLLGGTAVAMGAALARPYVARAADKKVLNVWWNQGFYQAEDQALFNIVHAWEKESGIKMNLSMVPGAPLDEKLVSAFTSGQVPDLIYSDDGAEQTVPQAAWAGQLLDVSDVVQTQLHEYSATALNSCKFYNNVAKKRAFYGVPLKGETLNVPTWKPLVEEAGYQMSDIPNTWDKFFDFFKPVQDKLRKKGMRHVYGLGYTLSTVGADPNNLFVQFLVAYGGSGVITPDGRPHFDDPTVQKAIVTAIEKLATPYKEGYIPPDAVNWADPDNNNAFHSKEVVMTPNDTISISSAVQDNKQFYYHDIVTVPLPHGNDGKPVPVMLQVPMAYIPKGSKNIDAAKSFLRYLIEPKHLDSYLREARARWLPVMPSMVKTDPYWLDPEDPHRPVAIKQGVLSPTEVWPFVYNPGYAQVDSEHLWDVAIAGVINGEKPEDAWAKVAKRVDAIFAKYPIA